MNRAKATASLSTITKKFTGANIILFSVFRSSDSFSLRASVDLLFEFFSFCIRVSVPHISFYHINFMFVCLCVFANKFALLRIHMAGGGMGKGMLLR